MAVVSTVNLRLKMSEEKEKELNPHESEKWSDNSMETKLLHVAIGLFVGLLYFTGNYHLASIIPISLFIVILCGYRSYKGWKPRLYGSVNIGFAVIVVLSGVLLWSVMPDYTQRFKGIVLLGFYAFRTYWLPFSVLFAFFQLTGIFKGSKYDNFPELCTVDDCEYCNPKDEPKMTLLTSILYALIIPYQLISIGFVFAQKGNCHIAFGAAVFSPIVVIILLVIQGKVLEIIDSRRNNVS
jgi:energy-converting hydrogenase Eha subunit C